MGRWGVGGQGGIKRAGGAAWGAERVGMQSGGGPWGGGAWCPLKRNSHLGNETAKVEGGCCAVQLRDLLCMTLQIRTGTAGVVEALARAA
jgi:hypothetical protein